MCASGFLLPHAFHVFFVKFLCSSEKKLILYLIDKLFATYTLPFDLRRSLQKIHLVYSLTRHHFVCVHVYCYLLNMLLVQYRRHFFAMVPARSKSTFLQEILRLIKKANQFFGLEPSLQQWCSFTNTA